MPGRATLWFAFLGGPVAWSAHLLASYPLVPLACESGSTLALNLVTLATLLVAGASAAAGALALRKVRGLAGATTDGAAAREAVAAETAPGEVAGGTAEPGGPSDATPEGTAPGRARFMARYGFWSGVFFTFVIAVEGLPPLLQNPCLGVG